MEGKLKEIMYMKRETVGKVRAACEGDRQMPESNGVLKHNGVRIGVWARGVGMRVFVGRRERGEKRRIELQQIIGRRVTSEREERLESRMR